MERAVHVHFKQLMVLTLRTLPSEFVFFLLIVWAFVRFLPQGFKLRPLVMPFFLFYFFFFFFLFSFKLFPRRTQ